MTLDRVLDDLEDYLRFERDEGRRTVEADPTLVRSLAAGTTPVTTPPPPRPLQPPPKAAAPTPPPVSAANAPPPPAAGVEAPYRRLGSTPELDAIAREVAACTRCGLCRGRTQTVPGQGSPRPELVFIGEGPGADEDQQGLAFVGQSGQLLTRLITAMELTREQVWIGNIVKCRPPENRTPTPAEMTACLPYLRAQLALLKPRVIVTLGNTAAKGLLDTDTGITKLHGTWQRFGAYDVMPTYHPSYLLRGGGDSPNSARFWEVWDDMTLVLKRLGKPVPDRRRPQR